jgi:hypothetical protein
MSFAFILAIVCGYYSFWCVKWDKSTRNMVESLRKSVFD